MANIRVLLVNDDEVVRLILTGVFLESEGYGLQPVRSKRALVPEAVSLFLLGFYAACHGRQRDATCQCPNAHAMNG